MYISFILFNFYSFTTTKIPTTIKNKCDNDNDGKNISDNNDGNNKDNNDLNSDNHNDHNDNNNDEENNNRESTMDPHYYLYL